MASMTKNFVYNILYQILAFISIVITTPYISRVISVDEIGKYSYTQSIVTYFTLAAALGITLYGRKEIAFSQDNRSNYSKKFWNITVLKIITTAVILTIYFILFVIRYNQYRYFFLIQSLDILAIAFDITWFFQGMENFKIIVIRNSIIKLISIISIFAFVKDESDIYIYILSISLSTLIGYVTLWPKAFSYVDALDVNFLKPLKHLIPAAALFLPQIVINIYTISDKTMIGLLTGSEAQNGYYEQSQKIIRLLQAVITSFGNVTAPRIAYYFAANNKKGIQKCIDTSARLVWFLGIPMTLGLLSVSNAFVPWYFGEGYAPVIPLLNVFSVLTIVIGLSNISGTQYMINTNKQRLFLISVLSGAILNVCLNYILIPRFLALGAAIASVIAECAITFIQFFMIRKEVNIKQIFSCAGKYCIAGIGMVIALYFSPDTNFIIQVMKGATIYFIFLLLQKEKNVLLIIDFAFKTVSDLLKRVFGEEK